MLTKRLMLRSVVLSTITVAAVGCNTGTGAGRGEQEDAVATSTAAVTTIRPEIFSTAETLAALGIVASATTDPQVIGGTTAAEGEWPWQANLGQLANPTSYYGTQVFPHFCGGSVISENWIVTAAHCVLGTAANTIMVRLGETTRSTAPDENIQIRGAKQIIVHPEYTGSQSYLVGHDIALIELNEPLVFTSRIRPIAMSVSDPAVNNSGWVTGWGRTVGSVLTQSDNLMEAQLPINAAATCNSKFAEYGVTGNYVNDHMICLGTDNGSVASCNGDSGGPLAYQLNAKSGWTLVGVVSWGLTGCISYSVHTRVSVNESWVRGIVPLAYKTGDVNRDGCVTAADAVLVKAALGTAASEDNILLDVNNDGTVSASDYTSVAYHIETGCTPTS